MLRAVSLSIHSPRQAPAAHWASAVEPRRQEPATVVVAEIRPVVLERTFPDCDVDARGWMHVILLRGQIALQLVDDLAALCDIEDPALADQHVGDDGVVDVALVLRLARSVHPAEEVVGLEYRCRG